MDEFSSHQAGLEAPAMRHRELVANAAADIPLRPRAIYCQAPGTITLRDEDGIDLPYTLEAGQVLSVRALRVMGITGGTFYGWS